MHIHTAPYGPPPPLVESDPTDDSPAYFRRWIEAQQRHTAWTVAQLDHYRDALALPNRRRIVACACTACTPPAVRWAAPWTPPAPASTAARWQHLAGRIRTEQQHQRRAAAALAAAPPRFPKFPTLARITRADALAAALHACAVRVSKDERPTGFPTYHKADDIPTKASQSRHAKPWPERDRTLPASYTTTERPALAVPGHVPIVLELAPDATTAEVLELLDLLDLDYEADASHVLRPGRTAYLTAGRYTGGRHEGGTVTARTVADVDGRVLPTTGGRGNTSKRPSTVPPEAVKSRNALTLPDGKRQRVWLALTPGGVPMAWTMSGHAIVTTQQMRRAALAQIAPQSAHKTI